MQLYEMRALETQTQTHCDRRWRQITQVPNVLCKFCAEHLNFDRPLSALLAATFAFSAAKAAAYGTSQEQIVH
jgi:hypothetical protein